MFQNAVCQLLQFCEDRRPLRRTAMRSLRRAAGIPCCVRCRFDLRQQRSALLAEMVVGRDEPDPGEISLVLHRQRPEGGNRRDLHPRFCKGSGELWVRRQCKHDPFRVLTADGTRAVGQDPLFLIRHGSALHGHQVAAVAGIARAEGDAEGCRLHGRTPGKVFQRVTAEDRQDGCLTAGRQRLRAVDHAPHLAPGRQGIDHRVFRVLQRRPVSQGRDRVVRHAVSDHKKILHI